MCLIRRLAAHSDGTTARSAIPSTVAEATPGGKRAKGSVKASGGSLNGQVTSTTASLSGRHWTPARKNGKGGKPNANPRSRWPGGRRRTSEGRSLLPSIVPGLARPSMLLRNRRCDWCELVRRGALFAAAARS
jgi:hypothetical protein